MVVEKFILTNILGWKCKGSFPQTPKSVIVFAPHTSYFDAIFGTLCLRSFGINYTIFIKKELFFFPMNIVMRMLKARPVRGVKGHNAIYEACEMFNAEDNIHLVICPEGTLKPTEKWNPGFLYIASKSHIPVVAVYMDFEKHEYGVKGFISDNYDKKDVFSKLRDYYSGVNAYNPEKFVLPKIN